MAQVYTLEYLRSVAVSALPLTITTSEEASYAAEHGWYRCVIGEGFHRLGVPHIIELLTATNEIHLEPTPT